MKLKQMFVKSLKSFRESHPNKPITSELRSIPNVNEMDCELNWEFTDCIIHKCSTYGCLNCGQYVRIKK